MLLDLHYKKLRTPMGTVYEQTKRKGKHSLKDTRTSYKIMLRRNSKESGKKSTRKYPKEGSGTRNLKLLQRS